MEPGNIGATGEAEGAGRLGRKLLAERAQVGVPVGSSSGELLVARSTGLPGRSGRGSPVLNYTAPVSLRGHVEAAWLGRATMWAAATQPVDAAG